MSSLTDPVGPPPSRGHYITRDRLRSGAHLAELRANPIPGYEIRTDEELAACLASALAQRPPGDIWVFGYGSLMWNPAFDFAERKVAVVRGWHRRFCLWMHRGRGTPEKPGLMLALDRGGCCRGIAFRLAPEIAEEELLLLWRREMLSGSYEARWLDAHTPDGPVKAVTFVANRAHRRFAGALPEDRVAHHIATGCGHLGTCAEYLHETVDHLHELGFRDRSLERIRAHVPRG
jgi:cation transport protein ChaC